MRARYIEPANEGTRLRHGGQRRLQALRKLDAFLFANALGLWVEASDIGRIGLHMGENFP